MVSASASWNRDRYSKDPEVVVWTSFVGGEPVQRPPSIPGKLYSTSTADQRKAQSREIIDRLREVKEEVEGISLFMKRVQDVQIDSRVSRTENTNNCGRMPTNSNGGMGPKLLRKNEQLPSWRRSPVTTTRRFAGR